MSAAEAGDRAPRRPPDLRLAGFAAAVWLAALAALYLPACGGLLTAGVAAVAATLTAVVPSRRRTAAPARTPGARLRRRVAHLRWALVAVLLGAACGSAATAVRVAVRDAAPVAALAAAHAAVTVELVVTDDPRPLRGRPGPVTYLVPVGLTAVRTVGAGPAVRLDARALVLGADPAWRPLLPGQRLTATGRLQRPRGGDLNAAVLTTRRAPDLHGASSWLQRAAGSLRAGLQRACEPLPDDVGGLLPGLVVGDTSRLTPELEEDFRTTGMTHLNAVSGANVAILLGVVLYAARWARAGPALTAVVCAVALAAFVVLARPSPSVVRAAAMGAVGLLALAAGRPRAAVPALGAAVAALVLLDPELAGDAGFTLSVLATSGLLLLAPRWRDALVRRRWPAWAAEALTVPAAAQLVCGPVVAALSGSVSLVAVPANLLAAPAVAPATVLGVGAAALSPWWADGAAFTAWLGAWPARWLVVVATSGARLPAGAVPWPGGVAGAALLAVLSAAVLVAVRRRLPRRVLAAVTAGTVLGVLPVRLLAPGWPPPGWLVVACAVGQGDAVVLPAGAGTAVVVDAGPEPGPVDGCLRRLGVRRVAAFVVSHYHADHVGGVAGVFRGRDVGTVLVPEFGEPAAGRAAVLRAAAVARTPVRRAGYGQRWAVPGLRLTVLGPPGPLRGTSSDPNNNSLILRADVAGRTVLLPGDAESDEQQAVLAAAGPHRLRADVLKVAHHGSADQHPGFLAAVRPAVALVSAGRGNRYGHPDPGLVAGLSGGGARVLRTDLLGDVAAVRAGDGLAVVARGEPP